MNKIYLAGPLFSRAEQSWNSWLKSKLKEAGLDCVLPQDEIDPSLHPLDIAEECLRRLGECNAVVACLDGADADSGTCFEVGYAYANSIPVVGYRTDFRQTGDAGELNAMLYLCKRLIILKQGDDIITKLCSALDDVIDWRPNYGRD